jgi:predicted transposase YbfD/YdcC
MKDLIEQLDTIQDFRVKGRCLHKLSDILGLMLCAIIADCDDFSEIVDYGKAKKDYLITVLGFEFANGIPSEDTLDRVLRYLDPKELSKCYQNCFAILQEKLIDKQIAIDGKQLRGTIPSGKKNALVQMVNMWVCNEQISFGQVQIADKSNEITAIPELLDMVECQEAIVTIDAIGCQKAITEKIINKGANYLISLKKNQKDLYTEVSEYFQKRVEKLPFYRTLDKDHGRGEERKIYVCPCDTNYIYEAREWAKIETIIMVERSRITKNKTETTQSFYISSLNNPEGKDIANLIRSHWSIENQLHWQLDFTFKEDASKVRKDNAPINLHLMRKWVLALLNKTITPKKISVKRKRKEAARNDEFLLQVIKG